ncbi:MAG TPA: hypothetical protein VF316_13105, partial [Polyangiaceae bacterium]
LRLLVPEGVERIAEVGREMVGESVRPAVEVAAPVVEAAPAVATRARPPRFPAWPIWIAGIVVVAVAAAGLVWILR